MTMNSTGAISLGGSTAGQSINLELGQSATAQVSLNDANVRSLAGVASGAIIMPTNFYGKSSSFSFSITANTTNVNLRSLAITRGWNQTSQLIVTIASGIIVSSTSIATPALTVNGSFPGGVSLTNLGSIIGMGGAGGNGSGTTPGPTLVAGTAGGSGGLALSVSSAITITNNGTIAGGGWSGTTNSTGGTGGTATYGSSQNPGNAGTAGSLTGNGTGGAAVYSAGVGGDGGGYGAAGNTGGAKTLQNSSGGPYAGGSGGGAVSGNANITWLAFGTRVGSIT